jgi:hypothetical protein
LDRAAQADLRDPGLTNVTSNWDPDFFQPQRSRSPVKCNTDPVSKALGLLVELGPECLGWQTPKAVVLAGCRRLCGIDVLGANTCQQGL